MSEEPGAEPALLAAQPRSDHTAVVEGNVLYVWGGYQCVDGVESILPSDEIWLYDMDSGLWSSWGMGGEVPPALSQPCGSYLRGCLYVFGGCDANNHTNQLYCVDLTDGKYRWRRLKDTLGTTPSPRNKHSCWVHRDRLIYFGGYGCKTVREVNDSKSFTEDETSWALIGTVFYRLWGWNNEIHVFEPDAASWTQPHTQGHPPTPRCAHASATLGGRGYVCGGLETQALDIHCLDFDTWTWSQVDPLSGPLPIGRSLHTLTPTSDTTLFLFGGLSWTGDALSDGWEFDTVKREWRERQHAHKDKPRLWHTADQGKDGDVVVFGGSQEYTLLMDSVTILRAPSESHSRDVLVFQSQPYSLTRLCEDCIGTNGALLSQQASWLPAKLLTTVHRRMAFFKTTAEHPEKHSWT